MEETVAMHHSCIFPAFLASVHFATGTASAMRFRFVAFPVVFSPIM